MGSERHLGNKIRIADRYDLVDLDKVAFPVACSAAAPGLVAARIARPRAKCSGKYARLRPPGDLKRRQNQKSIRAIHERPSL